jgi:indole-3-glycerol phosphate synthase
MTILDEICATTAQKISLKKKMYPIDLIEKKARIQDPVREFYRKLRAQSQQGFALIAEIKKASPSAGLIRPDFSPSQLALNYQAGGATCLSVLTNEDYFKGHDDYLKIVHSTVSLPVLRKDFMLDPWQIIESRSLGADCILLIMSILSDQQAQELEQVAEEWKLDVLIEVHSRQELDRALRLRSPLIGINNRNLKTMITDLKTTENLVSHIPADRLIISESGLKTYEDLIRLKSYGVSSFLIGESLMKEKDVKGATIKLLTGKLLTGKDLTDKENLNRTL